tara:strand:- start:42 stop:362 length:321 start_codon:yes stop_codon:yes gene_type:complete
MNATTTLVIDQDSFDGEADFTFEYKGYSGRTRTASGYLFQSDDGQIYLMQNSSVLKSHYSDADRAERERLNSMEPVRDGDVVTVEDKQYKVKILGDFSDAGRLYAI